MFITKKHLLRRTFLRGVGATIALPLLDAMIPARTALAATAAKPMPRAAFVYFPHGAIMKEWTPSREGRNVELGKILAPLAPFKDRLTVISGLENRHADGPVHAMTPGTWLSPVSPRSSSDPLAGATADQVAARHLGQDVPLPSIQVATEGARRIGHGAWEGELGESYAATVSFRTPSAPLPMVHSPRSLFERLFASTRTNGDGSVRPSTSIIDRVADEAAALQKRLGAADRATVRDYLETVRHVEQRVAVAEARMHSVESHDGMTNAFDGRVHLMFDMVALAFQTGITRVVSFMMAAEMSETAYQHLGVTDGFHMLSHHQNDPEKIEKLVRIQTYNTEAFAAFVAKLEKMPDGDASMLDRSLILFGSNMSNSYTHDHFPLPMALVGGGCGKLNGGQHVRYADHTPMSNLLLSMLDRAGVPLQSFGDSTGECAEI